LSEQPSHPHAPKSFDSQGRLANWCPSKEKRSGVDAGRPELKRCLEYLREGDTPLVTKIDCLARSTSDLYRIVSGLRRRALRSR
jgi:DNA invertase Pin-like site-specific DNA recombinase